MITISNSLKIPLRSLSLELLEEIKARLTFENPSYLEAKGRLRAMGRPNATPQNIPRIIRGWAYQQGFLVTPRGCASEIAKLLGMPHTADNTRKLARVDFQFKGQLKPSQEPAVRAILSRRFATVCSPTGSGKTVMALYAISERRQPALVTVHTAALAKQWVERASTFLGLEGSEIGIIGQGQRRVGKRLTVALVQTLQKCAREVAPLIGHLVVDECHHVPAATFTGAIQPFDCAYMLGLSATHERRDGLTPLIYWYVGPLVYEVSKSSLVRDNIIMRVEPVIRESLWEPGDDIKSDLELMTRVAADGYKGVKTELTKEEKQQLGKSRDVRARLISEMIQDYRRNSQIVEDVMQECRNGPCIVLTDRTIHAETLADLLRASWVRAEVCHGGIPRKRQGEIIKGLNDGEIQVLVATGQLLGEGFDCKRLSALFLATPIRFSGRLIQYLGRVARVAEGKAHAKVYDYWDVNVPTLMRAAKERMRTYRKLERESSIKAAPTIRR
jgi:superfamily II DNA or RNA helicase